MISSRVSKFETYTTKIAILVSAIALMLFAWGNLFLNINISANAATLDGISNQVEGKVQKDIGTVKRATSDLTGDYVGEVKGAAQQAKGKAKQDIGTTQNKLDDAKDAVENKSENLIDSVKDFFD